VDQADLLRRGAAEFVGTFTLIFRFVPCVAMIEPAPMPRPGDAASI